MSYVYLVYRCGVMDIEKSVRDSNLVKIFRTNLGIAKLIVQQTQTNSPAKAVEFAIAKTEKETGADLSDFKDLLNPSNTTSNNEKYIDLDVKRFVDERCVRGGRVARAQLYAAYIAWCNQQNIPFPRSTKYIARAIRLCEGVEESKSQTGARAWAGIHLKDNP